MKKRKLLAVVGLTIITLGIYDIFWLVKTKKELNSKTRVHTPSIWLLFVPLLLFIASLIALVISVATSASNVSTNTNYNFNSSTSNFNFNTQPTTTSTSGPSGTAVIFIVLYILAIILWFVLSFYWFLKFSKAINQYTDGKMGKGETFLLLWVLHLFGVLLIQDTFNDMIDEGTIPDEPANQPSNEPAPQAPPLQPSSNTQTAATNAATPTPVNIQPAVISPTSNQDPGSITSQPAVVVSPSTPDQSVQPEGQGPVVMQ